MPPNARRAATTTPSSSRSIASPPQTAEMSQSNRFETL
jgi:hypothetical protein